MEEQKKNSKKQYIIISFLLVFAVILSYYNFDLFHISIEIYSIVIAFIIFIIIINTHQIISNNYYIFIGIAFGFIAVFELMHTFTYEAINVFPFPPEPVSSQIWFLGRLTQALALLISFVYMKKKLNTLRLAYLFSLYTITLIGSLFYFNKTILEFIPSFTFKDRVFEGEYVIILILLITLYLLYKKKRDFSEYHYKNMFKAVIFFSISELFFFVPFINNNIDNIFGQIARLLSFYFIYRSVVITGLKEPYNSIFFKLAQSNKKLSDLNQILNIVKNIHETINVSFELDNLFEKIVDILIKKEDYQMAFIGEYIKEEDLIKIKSSVGISSDYLDKDNLNLKIHDNAVTQSIKKRRIIKDSNPSSVVNMFENKNHNIHNSLIALPIYYDNNIYGVLAITSYKSDAFDGRTIELLSKIIENLGIAITRYYNQKKIKYLSFHDQLTGLYNKNFFYEEINRLDTSRKLPISIIISDFNNLKSINDNYGHDIGDKFLKTYAEILKNNSRQEDIIARWGGDEFVILLPNANQEITKNLLERIKNAIGEIKIKDEKLSVAFGYAVKESKEQDIEDIFKQADNDMYCNKKLIKNNGKGNH